MSKNHFVSADCLTRIARIVGLALLIALPALAQSSSGSAPTLNSTLGDTPQAPTPTDQNGNPIQAQPPTEAQREVARAEEARRAENQRAEEQRQATEIRRVADEHRADGQLAEEQKFHSQIMTAVYVGLAIVALLLVSRLFKRSPA
jgi:hypothetical protein